MTQHFQQEAFVSDGFRPEKDSVNRSSENIEILQVLSAPDPKAETVPAAFAGRIGDAFVSGVQTYVRTDVSEIKWGMQESDDYAVYLKGIPSGKGINKDPRPSFLNRNDAFKVFSHIDDEAVGPDQDLPPAYLASGKPVLSGRIFKSAEDAMEDGRILATLSSPDLAEDMRKELESVRPAPHTTVSDKATIKAQFEANENSLASFAINGRVDASVAAAQLVMSGAVSPGDRMVHAAHSAGSRKDSLEDISATILQVRSEIPREAEGAQRMAIEMTGVQKAYRDNAPMTPEAHASAFRRIEKAALANYSKGFGSLYKVYYGVNGVSQEMTRPAQNRDRGGER